MNTKTNEYVRGIILDWLMNGKQVLFDGKALSVSILISDSVRQALDIASTAEFASLIPWIQQYMDFQSVDWIDHIVTDGAITLSHCEEWLR